MIAFLRGLLGLKPPAPTAMIRVQRQSLLEPSWVRVQVLPPAEDGTRRFFWPGPCGFEFNAQASFVEDIQ